MIEENHLRSTIFSITLERTGSKEMGLKSDKDGFTHLGIGTTNDVFRESGKMHKEKLNLQMWCTAGARRSQ